MRKLILLALLSLLSCTIRAQDAPDPSLGKPAYIGPWSYFVRNDPAETLKVAMIQSPFLQFQDTSGFTSLFVVQHESGELQFSLTNDAGRFAISSLGDFVTMKFDNKPLVKWRVNHGNNKSPHMLFLTDEKYFYE